MPLFQFPEKDVITPEFISQDLREIESAIANVDIATFGVSRGLGAVSYLKDTGPNVRALDLQDQFIVFQFASKADEPTILESSQVAPVLAGSENEPDVLVNLEMQSFHVGQNEQIDKNSRATMRINMGKDENSRDTYFDTAFWVDCGRVKSLQPV